MRGTELGEEEDEREFDPPSGGGGVGLIWWPTPYKVALQGSRTYPDAHYLVAPTWQWGHSPAADRWGCFRWRRGWSFWCLLRARPGSGSSSPAADRWPRLWRGERAGPPVYLAEGPSFPSSGRENLAPGSRVLRLLVGPDDVRVCDLVGSSWERRLPGNFLLGQLALGWRPNDAVGPHTSD